MSGMLREPLVYGGWGGEEITGEDKFTRRKFSELASERLCCAEGDLDNTAFCNKHVYFILL